MGCMQSKHTCPASLVSPMGTASSSIHTKSILPDVADHASSSKRINVPPVVQNSSFCTTSADSADTAEASFCWICHDDELDDDGQPLINGCCSCRGSSGYCHLSCLVKHAESRTRTAVDRGAVNLHEKWLKCSNCEQQWIGHQLTIMGNKCSAFIAQEYPNDEELKIRALGIRRRGTVLSEMNTLDEQKETALDVISATEKLQTKSRVHTKPILLEIHDAYYTLGRVAIKSQEPAPAYAIQHYKRCEEILYMTGHNKTDIDVLKLQMHISEAAALLPDANKELCDEAILKLQTTVHTETMRKYGKTSLNSMVEAWNLAVTFFDLKRFDESNAVLVDLFEVSRHVHGTEHPKTKRIEGFMQKVLKQKELVSLQEVDDA